MTIRHFIFSVLWLLPVCASAQRIEGRVTTAEGTALSFVNIGVLSNTRGTVSDEEGYFQLQLDDMAGGDTLRFSLIGYESYDIGVAAARRQSAPLAIPLKAIAYDLAEVVVVPRKVREKVLGNRVSSKFAQGGFGNNELGHEIGVLMKVKGRPTWLEEVYLNIARCEYDSIFYRLNIYRVADKYPRETLLQTPIYLQYSQAEALGGELVVDLRPYQLYTEEDFVVSLEIVKDLGQGGLYLRAALRNKSYFRYTSQSSWTKIPVGLGIATKVQQQR